MKNKFANPQVTSFNPSFSQENFDEAMWSASQRGQEKVKIGWLARFCGFNRKDEVTVQSVKRAADKYGIQVIE